MPRKQLSMTEPVAAEQRLSPTLLAGRPRVPVAERLRQGICLVLARRADTLPG